jgi:Zn-finger nucleic acid-binding protein
MSAMRDAVLCPRDGARLVEVERDGVPVDTCPVCHGIWLDRGEFELLVESERRAGAAPDEDAERVERKRRRGGFLESFLDLGD